MQILQQNLLIINKTVSQSRKLAAAATHLASFHSTNAFSEKWKTKFGSGVTRDQEPSKIHYTVREKPSASKKALKDLLHNGGCSTSKHELASGYADRLNKKSRIKPAHHSKRTLYRKLKRKHQREDPYDDTGDDPAKAFFAAFGRDGATWNFRHRAQRSEWTENSNSSNSRFNKHNAECMTYADRKILGLPATGPLKMEDVKTAFRSSALKWHPDKHQGSSRAAAEEKFKHCVDAYKSLCTRVSSR